MTCPERSEGTLFSKIPNGVRDHYSLFSEIPKRSEGTLSPDEMFRMKHLPKKALHVTCIFYISG